jgi:hypothetical protein
MPYIFPKRTLKDGDVLDPTELNEDFVASADLYSGRLDQHNFSTAIQPTVAADAYYKSYYAYKEVEIDWGTTGSWEERPYRTDAIATGFGATQIPNDGSWETLAFSHGDKDASGIMSITAGSSVLWINAQLQYIWRGWERNGTHYFSRPIGSNYTVKGGNLGVNSTPARVQFAIRINGNVIFDALTGKELPYDREAEPVIAEVQRTISVLGTPPSPAPGPQQSYMYDTTAAGPEIFPIRISAVVPMSAGTHTVELVCRRLAVTGRIDPYMNDDAAGSSTTTTNGPDNIYVSNRQLGVVVLPTFATATTTFDSVTVEGFSAEDVISAESLGTDRVDVVRSKLNAVKPGALARGAFNHLHLSSMVGANTQQAEMVGVAPTYANASVNRYPGWSATGAAAFTTSDVGTGWRTLRAGTSGTELKTGAFTVNEESTLIIHGNVHLIRVKSEGATTVNTRFSGAAFIAAITGYWCALRIGCEIGSDEITFARSEANVNAFNTCGDARATAAGSGDFLSLAQLDQLISEQASVHVNVPLYLVLDISATGDYPVGTTFDYFTVYGAIMNDSTHEYRWQFGNLSVLQLKKGS